MGAGAAAEHEQKGEKSGKHNTTHFNNIYPDAVLTSFHAPYLAVRPRRLVTQRPRHSSSTQRHAPTAGPKWFNMPAPVVTPELKREIQAMRLRNALDPKRFFKQGSKDSALPEFFQVGHVLDSSQRATNAREGKTRKRTFVEELLEDDKAKAYAKRKFQDEVMVKGMSGRKNKHMTKRGGRKR